MNPAAGIYCAKVKGPLTKRARVGDRYWMKPRMVRGMRLAALAKKTGVRCVRIKGI